MASSYSDPSTVVVASLVFSLSFTVGQVLHTHFTDGEWRLRDRNNFSSSQIGLHLNHAK